MCANNSLDKNRQDLWHWGKSDLDGLVDYTFELQSRLRHLQDAAAQNSHNSSRPPSTDRGERPKPQSLRGKSGRKPGAQPSTATSGLNKGFSQLSHGEALNCTGIPWRDADR